MRLSDRALWLVSTGCPALSRLPLCRISLSILCERQLLGRLAQLDWVPATGARPGVWVSLDYGASNWVGGGLSAAGEEWCVSQKPVTGGTRMRGSALVA